MEVSIREMIRLEIGKEFCIEESTEAEQEIFIDRMDELLTKAAFGHGLSFLNEDENNELEILIDKQNNETDPLAKIKIVINYMSTKKIDYFKIYREEIIKMKIFIMRKNYIKRSKEEKEEFFEMVLDNFTSSAIDTELIPSNYESVADVGKITLGIAHNPGKNYLSKQERRNRVKFKIIVGLTPIIVAPLLTFLFYLTISLLFQYKFIASIPSWTEDIPSFIKNIVRFLIH